MATAILWLFFITLYVRPQDWVPGIVGFPTHFVLVPIGLIVGFSSHPNPAKALKTPHVRLLIVYLVLIFLCTLVNTDGSTAFEEFMIFFKRGMVFLLMLMLVSNEERLEQALKIMLILSMFLVYQGWLQYSTGESWGGMTRFPGYEEIRIRWYGDWDGPNVLGLLFTMSGALALELFFSGTSLAQRIWGGVAFVGSFAGIFFTNSRGAFLGVACAVAFYLKSRFKAWMAIPIAAAALGALVAIGPSRITEINSSESSASERVWLWEQGLTLLRENPIFGVGRGQFQKRVDLGLIAHNNFVQNFAESGLPGFLCFMGLIWFSVKPAYLVQRPGASSSSRILQSAGRRVVTMLIAYCTTTFFVVMENDLLYVVFGLGAALAVIADSHQPELELIKFRMKDAIGIGALTAGVLGAVWFAAIKQAI